MKTKAAVLYGPNSLVPLDRAAVMGCSITTGVGAVLFNVKVEPGSMVRWP